MKSKIGVSLVFHEKDLESKIHDSKEIGYDFVEIGIGTKIIPNTSFEIRMNTIRNIIPIFSVHLPGIDYKENEIEKCKKFIEILSDQGIRLFIIHLFSPNLQTEKNFDVKINALKYLTDFAKMRDIILTLENTEEDEITLKNVFEKIPEINFCLDIGHANLFAKKNRSIKLINHFAKLLKHIHISDNLGGDSESADLHLPLGEGKINFNPIFEKLKEINYSGSITLELFNPDWEPIKKSFKILRELF